MSLNNTKKARFMERSSEYSTRGSRRGTNLLGWEVPENLTPTEKRECLVARHKFLAGLCKTLPEGSEERKELGQEIHDVQMMLTELPKTKNHGINVADYVMAILKDEMPKVAYHRLLDRALAMKLEAEKKNYRTSPRLFRAKP